jgi:hypothetical protein
MVGQAVMGGTLLGWRYFDGKHAGIYIGEVAEMVDDLEQEAMQA